MNADAQAQLPFEVQPAAVRPTDAVVPVVPAQPSAPAADGEVESVNRRPPEESPLLLTVRDVEAALQLGRTATYELIRSGRLPVVRLGRAVRIPRTALVRWIDERCASGQP